MPELRITEIDEEISKAILEADQFQEELEQEKQKEIDELTCDECGAFNEECFDDCGCHDCIAKKDAHGQPSDYQENIHEEEYND